jgi:hypothetical protein
MYKIDANDLLHAQTTYYVDQPHIGMTDAAVVITTDLRSFTDGGFQYAKVWAFKAELYNVPDQECVTSLQYSSLAAITNAFHPAMVLATPA